MENLDSAPQETHSSKRLLIVLGLLVVAGLAAFYLLGGSQLMQGLLTPRPMTDAEVDREMSNVEGYVTVNRDDSSAWPLEAGRETAFFVSDTDVVFSSEDGAGEWIVINAQLAEPTTDGLTVIIQDSSGILPEDHAMVGATIDWGDGIMDETEDMDAEGLTFKHTYTSAGTYKVNYQLEDTEGRTDTFFITATAEAETETTDEPAAPLFTDLSCTGSVDAHGTKSLAFSYTAADGINIDNYRFALDVLDKDALGAPPMTSLQASGASYAISDTLAPGTHTLIAAIWTSEVFPVDGASTRCPLTIEESDPEPVEVTATCSANYTTSDSRLAYSITHDVAATDASQFRIRANVTAPDGTITGLEEHTMRESGGAFAEEIDPALSPGEYTVEFIVSMISSSTEVVRNTCSFTVEEPAPTPEPEPTFADARCTAEYTEATDTVVVTLNHSAADDAISEFKVRTQFNDSDGTLYSGALEDLGTNGEDYVYNISDDPFTLEPGSYTTEVEIIKAGLTRKKVTCDGGPFVVAAPEPEPAPEITASCDTSTRDHVIITLDHNILPVAEKYVLATFTKGSDHPIEMPSIALQGSGRRYDYILERPTGSYTAEIVVKNRTAEIIRTETTCTFPETSASTSTLHASVLLALASGGELPTEPEPIRNIIFAPAGSTVYFKAADEGSEGKNVQILVPGTYPEKMATLSITGEMPADSPTPINLPRRDSADPDIRPVSPTDADPADTDSPPEVLIEPVDSPPSLDIDEVPPVTADRPTPADPAPAGGGSGTPRPICSDGRDNDGDGRTDFPDDIGCDTPDDTDEYNRLSRTYAACEDGRDNDGDGRVDFPDDLGCDSYEDIDEENTAQEKVITGGTLLNDLCHDKTDPVKFDDLKKSWYAYDVVKSESSVEYDGVDKELRGEAIFVGYKDEKDEDERVFLKDRAINRVEAQKIVQVAVCLSDYLEEDEIDLDDLDNDFDDVPKDAWFTHFVNIGVEAGIIDDDKDEYHPYQDVTRAEFMALLVRAYAIITDTDILDFDDDLPFIDVDEDDWFADITYSAYKWGFSEGFTDSNGKQRLSPNRALTRGDAAVWLHNFFAILHDKELGDL